MRWLAALCLVLALPIPSGANICATDAVPAATLLFPFVVFDYTPEPSMFSNPPFARTNSVLTITNTASSAQIVHVHVWTDFDISIFGFNLLLTGYDTVSFSMEDILVHGRLPVTLLEPHSGPEGAASGGPVSESSTLTGSWLAGMLPSPAATSALDPLRCSASDPGYPGNYATPIAPQVLANYRVWLQGAQTAARSYADDCVPPYSGGSATSSWFDTRNADDETWFWVTADVVEECNLVGPASGTYFTSIARTDNVLTGHITWQYPPFMTVTAQAVHIEADVDLAAVVSDWITGRPGSFYHRHSQDGTLSDFREPLPTAWGFPYHDAAPFAATSVVAFKTPTMFDSIYDLELIPPTADPTSIVASNCYPYTYYSWTSAPSQ